MNEAPDLLTSPFAGEPGPRLLRWYERLLRRPQPELAQRAIAALFAEQSPHEVPASKVSEALQRYFAIGPHARIVALWIWSRALEAFLADSRLSDAEVRYLERLTRVLDIGFDDVEAMVAKLVHPKYQNAVAEAVADGSVSKEEKSFLKRLEDQLRMPSEVAAQLASNPSHAVAMKRLAEMMDDHRISPDELAAIARLDSDLNANIEIDPDVHARVLRYSSFWRIENVAVPIVHVAIGLQKGETCHFKGTAQWNELRTKTSRIDYHGPVMSIRIARGLRYRLGSISPSKVTREEITPIDIGTVYFTSKRVIFDGGKRNYSIRFSSLIGIEAFSDAIQLEKATGRSPYLVMEEEDVEQAVVILTTLMARGS